MTNIRNFRRIPYSFKLQWQKTRPCLKNFQSKTAKQSFQRKRSREITWKLELRLSDTWSVKFKKRSLSKLKDSQTYSTLYSKIKRKYLKSSANSLQTMAKLKNIKISMMNFSMKIQWSERWDPTMLRQANCSLKRRRRWLLPLGEPSIKSS